MCKPGSSYTVGDMTVELIEKLKVASRVIVKRKILAHPAEHTPVALPALARTTNQVVAIDLGAVDTVVPLQEIPRTILDSIERKDTAKKKAGKTPAEAPA